MLYRARLHDYDGWGVRYSSRKIPRFCSSRDIIFSIAHKMDPQLAPYLLLTRHALTSADDRPVYPKVGCIRLLPGILTSDTPAAAKQPQALKLLRDCALTLEILVREYATEG